MPPYRAAVVVQDERVGERVWAPEIGSRDATDEVVPLPVHLLLGERESLVHRSGPQAHRPEPVSRLAADLHPELEGLTRLERVRREVLYVQPWHRLRRRLEEVTSLTIAGGDPSPAPQRPSMS